MLRCSRCRPSRPTSPDDARTRNPADRHLRRRHRRLDERRGAGPDAARARSRDHAGPVETASARSAWVKRRSRQSSSSTGCWGSMRISSWRRPTPPSNWGSNSSTGFGRAIATCTRSACSEPTCTRQLSSFLAARGRNGMSDALIAFNAEMQAAYSAASSPCRAAQLRLSVRCRCLRRVPADLRGRPGGF